MWAFSLRIQDTPFSPLNPLRTPFSTASTTITSEHIENSEHKIAYNLLKNKPIIVKNITSQYFYWQKKRIISNEMLVNDVLGFCVITHN